MELSALDKAKNQSISELEYGFLSMALHQNIVTEKYKHTDS